MSILIVRDANEMFSDHLDRQAQFYARNVVDHNVLLAAEVVSSAYASIEYSYGEGVERAGWFRTFDSDCSYWLNKYFTEADIAKDREDFNTKFDAFLNGFGDAPDWE